jgi:glucose-6-phosphate 1-dehydrogenase
MDTKKGSRAAETSGAARESGRSDALVLFGITGDLAFKQIFPTPYAMTKRGVLKVPVVGVASSKWKLSDLRARATAGISNGGRIDDRRALDRLLSLLTYVQGDYNEPATYKALKMALGGARRPAY